MGKTPNFTCLLFWDGVDLKTENPKATVENKIWQYKNFSVCMAKEHKQSKDKWQNGKTLHIDK